ncbi:flagellar export chaperone FliS [Pleionea sediminis]|uniref:flagellar export chaperone FliS n=1 Tax=Pleionea sediminis TaxID=2569479 RepID=UPI0011847EDC|nr:flagellar export chaperone FliS [Pleionea sediminis]
MSISRAMTYAKMNTVTGIDSADPHTLVQMLLDGAIEKINKAKYSIKSQQTNKKGEFISWAISIIGGLQASLDIEKGGEVAQNLNDLYEFSVQHLVDANIENSEEKLDNVLKVLTNISDGWKGIREEVVESKKNNANSL